MRIPAILLLLLAAGADPDITITVGKPSSKGWPVSGKVRLSDETLLMVKATRVDRVWNDRDGKLLETSSDHHRLQRNVEVFGRAFRTRFRGPAPSGLYLLQVSKGEEVLHRERFFLGSRTPWFKALQRAVNQLQELERSAGGFLDEVERRLANGPGSPDEKKAFLARVQKLEKNLRKLQKECDLSAAVDWTASVFENLRNAQVWKRGSTGSPMGDNDALAGAKPFASSHLTVKSLRSRIGAIRKIVHRETELVSLQAVAGASPKLIAGLVQLQESMPDADPDVVVLLQEPGEGLAEAIAARLDGKQRHR